MRSCSEPGTRPGSWRGRWSAGCRTPPPRWRWSSSSAPRAAATPWPARSPAVYGVCNAVGQPLLGRAVDLYGQPRVMLPASVLSALGMALLAAVGLDVLWLAYAAMVIAGFFTPPLEGGLRALWPGVLKRADRVHAAYALDAVAQEVMFAVGPLLVTLCVAAWSEGVGAAGDQPDRGARRALRGRLRAVPAVAQRAAGGALAGCVALGRDAGADRRVLLRGAGAGVDRGRGGGVRRRARRGDGLQPAAVRAGCRRADRRPGLRRARMAGAAGGPAAAVDPRCWHWAICRWCWCRGWSG